MEEEEGINLKILDKDFEMRRRKISDIVKVLIIILYGIVIDLFVALKISNVSSSCFLIADISLD